MTIKLPLPGDGIGPEIVTVTRRVLEAADRRFSPGLTFEQTPCQLAAPAAMSLAEARSEHPMEDRHDHL
jgi:isocitrate/isopropylmalate dehydrogenase